MNILTVLAESDKEAIGWGLVILMIFYILFPVIVVYQLSYVNHYLKKIHRRIEDHAIAEKIRRQKERGIPPFPKGADPFE